MDKNQSRWPALDFGEVQHTLETLHQWIQIVGKIRLKTMPWQNHSWHTTLYVSSTGFTTGPIPYKKGMFQIDFDFKEHKLKIHRTNYKSLSLELYSRTVADFYAELFEKLSELEIKVKIHPRPNEMEPAIPFATNTVNKSYDPESGQKIWQSMCTVNKIFHEFRSGFVGKCSPVHLFWGAFDLAVTRFSGRPAPLHPGEMPNMPKDVMQEAYSQEVSSAGFWPGSKDFPVPVFYSYSYPTAPDFKNQKVLPDESFYDDNMGEFFLKYDDVRLSNNPKQMLFDFLETTYKAAANTLNWDRKNLERQL